MNPLQVLNAGILATGAALGLVLGAVCVIYLFHVSGEPRLRGELGALLVLSGGFWCLAGAGALAFFAQRRGWKWRWLAQTLPLLPVAGIAGFILSLG